MNQVINQINCVIFLIDLKRHNLQIVPLIIKIDIQNLVFVIVCVTIKSSLFPKGITSDLFVYVIFINVFICMGDF